LALRKVAATLRSAYPHVLAPAAQRRSKRAK
jgi:hypothetical protein